ncbi:putative endoplasmic reticulum metallopeptidase 1 [Cocos nucifera]|uniref:Putative endoplasmic reticulum metallopeptidase 1 n=1 Tax=Cocos nucifera TaxID=13894 RepID=A0A8K0HZY3_COCNU|nr:putative endoplasmic reticulum metallopeptidase 1 [Cocos nucifera]
MVSWLSSGDARAFKCLLALALMYGAMSYLAYIVIHTRHVRPLGSDAPPNRFSEARAIEHIRYLTVDIDGRQEGRPGLEEAAKYIRGQLEGLADRAGPNYR